MMHTQGFLQLAAQLEAKAKTWRGKLQIQVYGTEFIMWLMHRDGLHDQIGIARASDEYALLEDTKTKFDAFGEDGPWPQ